jgi:hypothetical protein
MNWGEYFGSITTYATDLEVAAAINSRGMFIPLRLTTSTRSSSLKGRDAISRCQMGATLADAAHVSEVYRTRLRPEPDPRLPPDTRVTVILSKSTRRPFIGNTSNLGAPFAAPICLSTVHVAQYTHTSTPDAMKQARTKAVVVFIVIQVLRRIYHTTKRYVHLRHVHSERSATDGSIVFPYATGRRSASAALNPTTATAARSGIEPFGVAS